MGAAAAAAVKPPPGFELDSDTPAPPEGFELDSQAPPRAYPGMGQDPNAPAGMLTPPNPSSPEPTARNFMPGGAPPAEPPTGPAGIPSSPRDKVPAQAGMRFKPSPIRPLTPPQNPATIPGPNRFYDFYEKYLGGPAEAAAQIYTSLPQLPMQGARGIYGIFTGEDPMKTEAAQQRIGAATTWEPRTTEGQTNAMVAQKILGYPTIPAERAGQYLSDKGHPAYATGARIALDPYNYIPFLFRGAKPEAMVGPPRPSGLRVEPGVGKGPPAPSGGRPEPTVGALPQQPPPEFKPIGEGPPLPATPRAEPAVGGLPEVPGPELKPIGGEAKPAAPVSSAMRVVDEKGAPVEQVPAGKPRVKPKTPQVSQVYTNAEGIPEVSINETVVPESPTVENSSPAPRGTVENSTPTPAAPTTTYDLLGSYRKQNPGYQPKAYLSVQDSEVRSGGTAEGTPRKVNQSVAFDQDIERMLVEPARLQRLAQMERQRSTGNPQRAAEYDAQAAQAFEKLQDRVRNLAPEEVERYGFLQDAPLTDLQRTSERYYDQVRGQMMRARESRPDAKGVQIRARPFERHYKDAGGEEPPPAEGNASVADLAKVKPILPLEGEVGDAKAGSLARAKEELQAGSTRPVEVTITEQGPRVTDGRHLLQAAQELGVENLPVRVIGGTLEDAVPKPPGVVASSASEAPKPPQSEYQQRRAMLLQDLERAKRNPAPLPTDPDVGYQDRATVIGKELKGMAMREAAEERARTGNLTGKERAAKEAREASNYVGKQVTAGGQPGTVKGMSFGRVRVQMADGTVKSFVPEAVGPPAPPSGAGGTLSSNPIPSPVSAVRAARELTGAAGGALAPTKVGKLITDNPLARTIKKVQEGTRTFMNAVQTMPEEAHEPVMMAHDFVREQQANAYKAYTERRQPGADLDAINKTEQDAYQVAKDKLQQDLLDNGYAQIGGRGEDAAGFVPIHARALEFGKGMYLSVRKDVAPAVRQMVQAYDSTAPGEILARKVEDVWNTPQTFMMWDPAFHIGTVAGRMEPYIVKGNSLLKPEHYRFAKDTFTDPDAYQGLIKDGLQPMKMTYSQRDFGAHAGAIEKAGGAVYDAWQAFHQKMPQAVNFMQLQFFDMMKKDLLAKGMPEDAAHATAIRQANNIAGNIPKEEMGRAWGHMLKFGVFSKTYTSSVIRQMTGSLMDDKLLMAQLERKGYGPEQVRDFLETNKDQFTKGLILDYVNNYAISQALNYWRTGADNAPDKNGKKGAHFTWDNPGASKSEGIMPQRIYLGNKDGKDLYIETPMRTVRDMYLFMAQSGQILNGAQPDWLRRKSNPTTRFMAETAAGADVYGKPIGDAPGAVAHAVSATGPWNEMPHAAAEAYREGNMSYLTGYLSSELDMPEQTIMKVLGLQPHTERVGEEARAQSREAYKAQDKLKARAREARENWPNMTPQGQAATSEAFRKDALKAGMDAPDVLKTLNYIKRQTQSNKSIKTGQNYEQRNKD